MSPHEQSGNRKENDLVAVYSWSREEMGGGLGPDNRMSNRCM